LRTCPFFKKTRLSFKRESSHKGRKRVRGAEWAQRKRNGNECSHESSNESAGMDKNMKENRGKSSKKKKRGNFGHETFEGVATPRGSIE